MSAPAAIRATIPEQGRLLTFHRSVQVDKWADMQIALKATAARTVSFGIKLGTSVAVFVAFGLLLLISRALRARQAQ